MNPAVAADLKSFREGIRPVCQMSGSESHSQHLILMKCKNVQPVAAVEGIWNKMTKIIGLLLLLAMVVQIIKPLGFPGLKRRADFWKLAVLAFVSWAIILLLRDFT